jgi:ABC-type antimicrobial peptide transport system, permease component
MVAKKAQSALQHDAAQLYAAATAFIRIYQFRDRDQALRFGLTVVQAYTLDILLGTGGVGLTRLAQALRLDKSTTSRVVSGMTRHGLIEWSRAKHDRRARRSSPPGKGSAGTSDSAAPSWPTTPGYSRPIRRASDRRPSPSCDSSPTGPPAPLSLSWETPMPTIPQELHYAVRSLRRSPLVSCFIVATLAICIGAVAAVYSVADVVLIRGLPYDRPEQLVWISSVSPDRPDRPVTLPEFMDYRAQTRTVRIGGYASWSGILERTSGAVRLQGLRMSGDGLAILGASPSVGRLLTASDDQPGAPKVIMLGYRSWRRDFGADPGVIGRTLLVSGERHTIVGILPRFFPLPVVDVDAVVPLDPESDPLRHERNSVNFIRVFGRVLPPATAAAADRELNTLAARLKKQFPTEYAAKIGVKVTPLQEHLATTLKPTLVILLACVALMIAVALANVLNLLLARAVGRQGDTAIRLALGASSPRIALQFLIEGALLATTAGMIGTWLAHLAISYGASHLGRIAPRIEEARLGLPVLGLVFTVCAIAVVLFSLVSILIARTASPQVVLQGLGRSGSASPAQARLRSSFVVAEVALALIITAAARHCCRTSSLSSESIWDIVPIRCSSAESRCRPRSTRRRRI